MFKLILDSGSFMNERSLLAKDPTGLLVDMYSFIEGKFSDFVDGTNLFIFNLLTFYYSNTYFNKNKWLYIKFLF